MKIEMNKLTRAVESKRQQIMENKAMEKRLLSELKTKFSISSLIEAKQFVEDSLSKTERIKSKRDKMLSDFIDEYGQQLGIEI